MKGFGKGLTVVDADLNESGKGAKYVVTYNYTPPAAIQSNDLASLTSRMLAAISLSAPRISLGRVSSKIT